MKMEFNTNNFSANMTGEKEKNTIDSTGYIKSVINDNKPLFFAIIAFAVALANLPFGLIINLSSEFFGKILDENAVHLTVILVSVSAIISIISVLVGAFALVTYFSSKKSTKDKAGLFVSIFSFIINVLCLLLVILGLVAW